jgi:hypothetical protein
MKFIKILPAMRRFLPHPASPDRRGGVITISKLSP